MPDAGRERYIALLDGELFSATASEILDRLSPGYRQDPDQASARDALAQDAIRHYCEADFTDAAGNPLQRPNLVVIEHPGIAWISDPELGHGCGPSISLFYGDEDLLVVGLSALRFVDLEIFSATELLWEPSWPAKGRPEPEPF